MLVVTHADEIGMSKNNKDWIWDCQEEIAEALNMVFSSPEKYDSARLSLFVLDQEQHYTLNVVLSEVCFQPEGQPQLSEDESSRNSHLTGLAELSKGNPVEAAKLLIEILE